MPSIARSLVVALLLLGCSDNGPETAQTERERVLGPFLSEHLRFPVPPQGSPPMAFSAAEASLAPEVCGSCHPEQHAQWRSSLHAAAYSPGFSGQLIEGALAKPARLRACQACHAPLAEQQPFDANLKPNAEYDAALRAQGMVCASCHVRAHTRYGPPRRDGLPSGPEPHGGFEARREFQQSRFCAQCHQFFDDEGANGKPVQNTFIEWQQSPQAAAGRQCQDCHMPDRAHLWRGIHDPNMVRSGVNVDLLPLDLSGEQVRATLVLANTDVGHAFPTYITPRVFLEMHQVDATGAELADTRVEGVIGREVDLATMVENMDTRVLPGESASLEYALPRDPAAAALLGRIRIDPDYHYRSVFAHLVTSYTDPNALAQIEEAIRRISDSSYVLAEIRLDL